MNRPHHPTNCRFVGVPCRKMPPTLQHRMAIWENMLGTVYAMNDAGEIRYFDYDHTAARAFAGATDASRDLRLARAKGGSYGNYQRPRRGQYILWILNANTNTEET